MESISGLPAHPLFVHAPVVLMPLTMLAAVAVALRPSWRRRYGPALAVGALVVLVATLLAVSSGEAFEELAGSGIDVDEHQRLAEATRLLVGAFFAGTLVVAVLDRVRRSDPPSWLAPATQVAAGVTAVAALLAAFWMYRTGHEGARLVWEGVVTTTSLPWGR